ncbi:MAG: RelA/SpoT family protein, partial [Bacteroidales bacterium]|nr:RelA/SpoT family protein [Bacteroidales bacterium]
NYIGVWNLPFSHSGIVLDDERRPKIAKSKGESLFLLPINIMTELNKNIQNKYRNLLRSASQKFSRDDQKKIRQALEILNDCCAGKTTMTGESLVEHSLSVARIIVGELGLGITSVIGALLAECSGTITKSEKELELMFGSRITPVLKGLRDIDDAKEKTDSFKAENFLKLLLSLAEDIRVILIKLADRLEYLRKMDGAEPKEQMMLASESYFLYAPLAHRLGLYNLKSEMEDISMLYLDPDAYNSISAKLKQTTASRNKFIREFTAPVRETLDKQGVKYVIKSRTKSIHSIWQKMKKQGVDFEEVYDLFAIRVIIESETSHEKSECWKVYSIIADLFQPNPSRLRDWISIPKSNGYESLHTTVIGPRGKWVEVQIRSTRMDEIAEKGLAAHTRYKGIKGESSFDNWLAEMRELLESPDTGDRDVIEDVTSELNSDEVFVFTPKGELKRMRSGATVLDFAFAIHTEVGSTCVGGKVNGKSVSIKHVLANGDKVSILTSRNQKPKRDWLAFAITSKAKNKIKVVLDEELVKAAAEGKEILQRRLKNWKIDFSDSLMAQLLSHYKAPNAREFFNQVYSEKIDLLDIKEFLSSDHKEKANGTEARSDDAIAQILPVEEPSNQKYSEFLVIQDKVEGLDYKLSPCCKPVLGDKIFGFVTITEGIKIHRTNCPNAHNMMQRYPYRVVMAKWTLGEETGAFHTSVRISGIDDHAMITRIHDVISDSNVTMRNFSYENKDGIFEGIIQLFVPNINTLKGLVKKLQAIKGVLKAARFSR